VGGLVLGGLAVLIGFVMTVVGFNSLGDAWF
jgi:hypothetical protein